MFLLLSHQTSVFFNHSNKGCANHDLVVMDDGWAVTWNSFHSSHSLKKIVFLKKYILPLPNTKFRSYTFFFLSLSQAFRVTGLPE